MHEWHGGLDLGFDPCQAEVETLFFSLKNETQMQLDYTKFNGCYICVSSCTQLLKKNVNSTQSASSCRKNEDFFVSESLNVKEKLIRFMTPKNPKLKLDDEKFSDRIYNQ